MFDDKCVWRSVVCAVSVLALALCSCATHSWRTSPRVEPPDPVKYTLAEDGNVSLALYDAQGTLIRELLRAAPQKAGPHSVLWDGRDQNARPLGGGTYSWKLLQTKGLTTEYVMMLGTRTSPDYADWPGDHGGPSALAVDETGFYVGASAGETVPVLAKQSLDGLSRLWTHFHYNRWNGPVKLAATGGKLYMHDGGALLTIDRDSGAKLAECKLGPGAMIAARGNEVVACFPTNDLVQWVNSQDGSALDSAAVRSPIDAALAADNSVLILSSNNVVSLTRADHKPIERIAGLTAPQRIAVDEVSGDIFVVEAGDSQQIKRFDAKYALQTTYGIKGGRPREGLYDQPTSFLGVTGICGDRQGGFFITEDGTAPRRTSHFNSKGDLLNEWYGGQQFFEYASPDPQNPSLVWFDSAWGWLVQAEVDYVNKTWKVRSTYSYLSVAPGLFDKEAKLFGGWHIAHRNNQTYLWADYGLPRIVRVDEANRRLVPIAAIGLADPGPPNPPAGQPRPPATGPKPWLNALVKQGLDATDFAIRNRYRAWSWADTNGNGIMDPEEFRLFDKPGFSYGPSSYPAGYLFLDENWSVYFPHSTPGTVGGVSAYDVIPNSGWTTAGGPTWDWASLTPGPASPGAVPSGLLKDETGAVYACMKGGGEGYGHGTQWSSDMYDGTAFVKYDRTGKLLFRVGPHATRKDAFAGQLHDPVRLLGKTHGCVAIGQRIIRPLEFFTEDGLYVGGAFDRRADDGLPERLYHWWRVDWDHGGDSAANKTTIQYDCLAGGSLHTFPDGQVFWYAPGWNMTPVYRIKGWENFKRQAGVIAVGRPPGLLGEYFNNRSLKGVPVLTRIDPNLWFNWRDKSPDDPANRPRIAGTNQPPVRLTNDCFSARWTGWVEAPLSEDFVFSTYNRGGVRVWVDGKLVIDDWKDYAGQVDWQRPEKYAKNASQPIALEAGRRYTLKVEFYHSGSFKGVCESRIHLNWESPTLQRQHVPLSALFPAHGAPMAP